MQLTVRSDSTSKVAAAVGLVYQKTSKTGTSQVKALSFQSQDALQDRREMAQASYSFKVLASSAQCFHECYISTATLPQAGGTIPAYLQTGGTDPKTQTQ